MYGTAWALLPALIAIVLALLTKEVYSSLFLGILMARSRRLLSADKAEREANGDDLVLYLTVRPENAIDASRSIRRFAEEHGISRRIAYRIALSMEEMVAYANAASKDDSVNTQIVVRFLGKKEARFSMLDDGECIALDGDEDRQALTTDNYSLLRRLAKSVEYQYVLNLNYTTIRFCDP